VHTMTSDELIIRDRLDRMQLTRLHLWVLAVCCISFAFDLMELSLGGVLSAVFSAGKYQGERYVLPWLLASVFMGAIFGAPAFGSFADRRGRRVALSRALYLLALTSIGEALSPGLIWLTGWRAASGLALGAFAPLVIAYLTEILPAKSRGRRIFLISGVAFFGPPTGIFLIRALSAQPLLQIDAWRWGFIIGAVGAIICAIIFRGLPESPMWFAKKGNLSAAYAECERFSKSPQLLKTRITIDCAGTAEIDMKSRTVPDNVRRSFKVFSGLNFLIPWATTAFPLLTGAVLMQRGIGLQNTLLLVGIASFGPIISVPVSLFIDYVPRRAVMSVCAIMMAVCGAVFVTSFGKTPLIISMAMFSLAAALYLPSMSLYGSELFVTQSRAVSMTFAWSLNRIGAALGPLVLVPILQANGPIAMFSIVVGTIALGLTVLAMGPRGRSRLTVA
jgi:MFS transporter, putative metabolite:H+ symporter